MALEPGNPVVGGTVLRRAAIQSPNFVHESAGWSVNQDGSAEFNNLTVRNGQIISGTDLIYSGTPALGDLIASIAALDGTDSFGNVIKGGIASYGSTAGQFIRLIGQIVELGSPNQTLSATINPFQAGTLVIESGTSNTPGDQQIPLTLASKLTAAGSGVPQVIIGGTSGTTQGMLEVQGPQAVRPAAGTTVTPLSVIANSNSGQALYVEQDGTTDHCITANMKGTGASQSAGNFVSSNPNFTTLQVTGAEKTRGTLKITHQGYADGSDANASALSIDVQTVTGGVTGTKARGIFITSTTDTNPAGDAITIRYNGLDAFVMKGSGRVAIGVAIGHTPSGQLEIQQTDTVTPGLSMTAIAAGTDMVLLKNSTGNSRFRVTNLGYLNIGESGTDPHMGVATLVAGTVTVANTTVTATTRIFLMCQTPGGTPGFLRVSARTAGTSFTILSSSATDTSVVAWLMIDPA